MKRAEWVRREATFEGILGEDFSEQRTLELRSA